ncbi:hypothetical protein HZC07_00590 [Candidatus Micrarchaeota archaeon]|nr:hypothetical protein [Candidatus Micrarchaeota archaeon]
MKQSENVWSSVAWQASYPVYEYQFLVPLRCADARDVGKLENEVTRRLIVEYAARGIMVNIHRIVRAGGIVNKYSSPEVKEALRDGLNQAIVQIGVDRLDPFGSNKKSKVPFAPVVQVSGHAEVKATTSDQKLVYSPEEIVLINDHSMINCGMSHASEVWVEVIEWLIKEKPKFEFYDKTVRKRVEIAINSRDALQRLLVSLYSHEGSTPEEFLTSIDLLCEPLKSKTYLRNELDKDNELSSLAIHINAGLRNFATGAEYRIDGNEHVHTLLDDKAAIMKFVMENLDENHPERKQRSSKQKPIAGLISSPNVQYPRETLIEYLRVTEGRQDIAVAGNVFLATGPNVLNPYSTFGAYKLGGILYSIMKLGIKDHYILAEDDAQAKIIEKKVRNDPILGLVFQKFNLKLTVLTTKRLEAEGIRNQITTIDPKIQKLIDQGVSHVLKLASHKHSALHRKVVAPEVLEIVKIL